MKRCKLKGEIIKLRGEIGQKTKHHSFLNFLIFFFVILLFFLRMTD